MASKLMRNVASEVKKLYGANAPQPAPERAKLDQLSEGNPHYSREELRIWLLNWQVLDREANHRLGWTALRADIRLAVAGIPMTDIRDFFELYCVLGYTWLEISTILDCELEDCEICWVMLLDYIYDALLDNRTYFIFKQRTMARPGRDSWTDPACSVVRRPYCNDDHAKGA